MIKTLKIIKKLLLLVAFVAIVCTAGAQEGKKRMLVDYFTKSSSVRANLADPVRNQVISGILKTNRLIVIDVDGEASLKIEESRRTSEEAMGDSAARLGETKKLGANYLLSGSVDLLSTEKKIHENKDSGKKTTYYVAALTFTLKVISVADGSVYASETYKVSGGGYLLGAGSTEQKAVDGAVSLVGDKMETFIDIYFPLIGEIAELKDAKKGKLNTCYITIGSVHGVAKGQYVEVSKITQIAGRTSTVVLGRMKIDSVVAEDLSECNVTKGGKEIYEAFQNGDKLVVKTIKDAGIGGLIK